MDFLSALLLSLAALTSAACAYRAAWWASEQSSYTIDMTRARGQAAVRFNTASQLAAFDAGRGPELSRALFEAYWGEDQDLSRDDVIAGAATRAGLDARALLERIATPELKQRLRANTDELVARGGFGSPTMIVNGSDLYFGNDRLVLVREALRRP